MKTKHMSVHTDWTKLVRGAGKVSIVIASLAVFGPINSAYANNSFLPAEADLPKAVNEIDPNTASDHIIRDYVGGLITYTQDVRCPVSGCNFPANTKVGTLNFDFAAYTGIRSSDNPLDPDTIGGAAIRGGFTFDAEFALKPDYKLRWLQVFREIVPGQPDNKEVDGDPFYPIFSITGIDAPLYDVPFDLLTRDITLSFESALVCVDCTDENQVKYIGSFLWGYSIADGIVSGSAPSSWGAPTASFIETVNANYPDVKLSEGCCIRKVPGPLPVMGVVAAFSYSRKIRKRISYRTTIKIDRLIN